MPKKTTTPKSKPKKRVQMTAAQVATAVRTHFGAERDGFGPEWAALDEFTLAYRRIDLMLVRAWSGGPKGHERIAVEIKVSRSDLASELAKPAKSQPFRDITHRFYLATPAGLVKDTDPIPSEWGLIEVSAGGRARIVRRGVRNDSPDPLPERAQVEAFRRAARTEARLRVAETDLRDDPAALVNAQKARDSAAGAAQRAQKTAYFEKRKHTEMLREIAAAGAWICVCGKELAARRDMSSWSEHADGTPCGHARYGRAEVDLEAAAARLGLTPAPPLDDVEVVVRAKSLLEVAVSRQDDPAQTIAALHELLRSAQYD